MSTTTKQTVVALWHYICPECGFGDGETGHHAPAHVIYCEFCLEERRTVRLKRWPVEGSGTAPGGAAAGGS
jgi:hypothetical protein